MTDAEKALQDQVRRLVELHPDIYPTEAKVWQKLRGDLRRGVWEKSPSKISFKNSNVSPPPDGYTGRAKSGAHCALTGEWVGKSKLEVDHIHGNMSLREPSDVLYFLAHMLSSGDQLQLVDKEAHRIKSYAERMGISFEEAQAEKKAIALEKLGVESVKEFIEKSGQEPASNSKMRRQQLRGIFQQED